MKHLSWEPSALCYSCILSYFSFYNCMATLNFNKYLVNINVPYGTINILIICSHTWLDPFWSLWLWAWIKGCMRVCNFRALVQQHLKNSGEQPSAQFLFPFGVIVQTCRKNNYVQCFDLIHILVNTRSHQLSWCYHYFACTYNN